MAEKVLMLALSPTMETGTIVNWIKNEGDTIETGDVLCEVETDKATMEYESIQEGLLLKILVGQGSSAVVAQPIAIIGAEGEDIGALIKEAEEEQQKAGAPAAATAISTAPAESPIQPDPVVQMPSPSGDGRLKASPLAKRLAEKKGLDIGAIRGSGPEGRIVKRDVETAKAGAPITAAPAASSLIAESIPISGKRRIIAQRLAESKYSAPHFYLKTGVFTELLMESRKKLNAGLDSKVSVNAFLMKFSAEAIKRHPVINSSWQGEVIQQFATVDIGLAVAQEDGLVTPIVRDCGSKGILQIDTELSELIGRARKNKLTPEDYTGSTFTISSLGTFGIEEFTAIINPPGSAILAVGQMQKVPVVEENDQISVRMQMKMTLSCDHRVIDGAQGARFLTDLRSMIENPIQALYYVEQ